MCASHLPPELLILIGQNLQTDLRSLLSFCLTSRTFYTLLCTVLYRHVQLSTSNSVISFCRAITFFQPQNAHCTISLRIGPNWTISSPSFRMQRDLVPSLRSALEVMPNLRSLSLSITPKALVLLLNDFKPPFKLDELSHSGGLSTPMIRFLEKQPWITKLEWSLFFSYKDCWELQRLIVKSPGFLPRLSELSGPTYVLAALIPFRPLTSILVLRDDKAFFLDPNELIRSFAHSMAPLLSICLVERSPLWHKWVTFMPRFRETHACATLKELRVVEAFPVLIHLSTTVKCSNSQAGSWKLVYSRVLEHLCISPCRLLCFGAVGSL
jgi:hypothetical protein